MPDLVQEPDTVLLVVAELAVHTMAVPAQTVVAYQELAVQQPIVGMGLQLAFVVSVQLTSLPERLVAAARQP